MQTHRFSSRYGSSAMTLRSQRTLADIDPLGFLLTLASHGDDVVPFTLADRPAYLVVDPQLIDSVLVARHSLFSKTEGLRRSKRLLGDGLLTAEGDLHRTRRARVQPAFGRRKLEGCIGLIRERASSTVRHWTPMSPFNVHKELAGLTLRIFGEVMFGTDVSRFTNDVRAAVDQATEASNPLISLVSPGRQLRRAALHLHRVVESLIIESRREGHADTILSLLDEEKDSGAISGQLMDDVLTLLLAGHDTLSNALTWTLLLLDGHDAARSVLQHEADAALSESSSDADIMQTLPWARQVFCESLRLYPPAWIIAREALVDVAIGSAQVPAGGIVLVSPYVMHRTEAFFKEADTFRPERWHSANFHAPRGAFIPFGFGHRACIGEGFAMMEGTIVLAVIARHWEVHSTVPSRLTPELRITMRPAQPHVTIEARQSTVPPLTTASETQGRWT